jgi:hypothetical protein
LAVRKRENKALVSNDSPLRVGFLGWFHRFFVVSEFALGCRVTALRSPENFPLHHMSEKESQLESLVFQGMVERIEMLGRIQALEKLVFDLHPALAARLQSMRSPSEGTS